MNVGTMHQFWSEHLVCNGGGNRPLAGKPSHDLLFIKLWAATLRMPEIQRAC